MATLRNRDGVWHVQIRRRGFPSITRSFSSYEWARRWAQETERNLERGQVPVNVRDLRSYLLRDLLERYRDQVTPKKRGADSERYRLNRLLLDPLASRSLDTLNQAAVAEYRDRRSKAVSGSSVRRELAILQHCLELARLEWNVPLAINPMKGIRLPAAGAPRCRRIEQDELDRLLAGAMDRAWYLAPIIRFAVATGMRRGEILSLTWADINLERRIARLPMTKNGKSRNVALSPLALKVLGSMPTSERVFPVSANAFRLSWVRLTASLGLRGLRFHDLRHEAISRFFDAGFTIPEVASVSGHLDTRTLLNYAHTRQTVLAKKLASAFGGAEFA